MIERNVGVVARGIRAPIVKKGDDLENIVVESIIKAGKSDDICFNNKDVVAVTESLLARAQGNFATIDNIAKDINNKFGEDEVRSNISYIKP